MMVGMTVAKITISIETRVLKGARGAIRRGRAKSLSAYISKAVEEKVADDDLMTMLDEMLEETGGPPTPEEEREAERALGIPHSSKRPKRGR